MTRRSTRLAAAVAALVLLALAALNVTGAAPIPLGPLGNHQDALLYGASVTIDYAADRVPIYLTAVVENTGSPLAVTVVRVTAIGVAVPGSVEILGSLAFNTDDPSQRDLNGQNDILLGIQADPGSAWTDPQPVTGVTVDPKGSALHEGRAFLVRITPDPTRETAVYGFDVEYRIGPLHFLTTAWGPAGTSILMCGADRPHASSDGCVAD
jgi:hypothetical protein